MILYQALPWRSYLFLFVNTKLRTLFLCSSLVVNLSVQFFQFLPIEFYQNLTVQNYRLQAKWALIRSSRRRYTVRASNSVFVILNKCSIDISCYFVVAANIHTLIFNHLQKSHSKINPDIFSIFSQGESWANDAQAV